MPLFVFTNVVQMRRGDAGIDTRRTGENEGFALFMQYGMGRRRDLNNDEDVIVQTEGDRWPKSTRERRGGDGSRLRETGCECILHPREMTDLRATVQNPQSPQ